MHKTHESQKSKFISFIEKNFQKPVYFDTERHVSFSLKDISFTE